MATPSHLSPSCVSRSSQRSSGASPPAPHPPSCGACEKWKGLLFYSLCLTTWKCLMRNSFLWLERKDPWEWSHIKLWLGVMSWKIGRALSVKMRGFLKVKATFSSRLWNQRQTAWLPRKSFVHKIQRSHWVRFLSIFEPTSFIVSTNASHLFIDWCHMLIWLHISWWFNLDSIGFIYLQGRWELWN